MNAGNKASDSDLVTVNGVEFTHKAIENVVATFYNRVAVDPVLKEPFQSVQDWPEHIERLTHFWWIRFGGKPYMFSHYNPVPKHYYAGFNPPRLERWLKLFHEVLQEQLNEEQCRIWVTISERMGQTLTAKNELFRVHEGQKLEKNKS